MIDIAWSNVLTFILGMLNCKMLGKIISVYQNHVKNNFSYS